MDDCIVARLQLEHLGEAVLVPRDRGVEIDVVLFALRGDGVLDRQLEDVVRLAPLVGPSRRKIRQRRQVRSKPAGRAAVDPGNDRVDLLLGKPPLVAERQTVVRVRRPRGHGARDDQVLDRARPRPGRGERRQRHRRDVARPVTRHAIVEQDRGDVPGERWSCLRLTGRHRRTWRHQHDSGRQHADCYRYTSHCLSHRSGPFGMPAAGISSIERGRAREKLTRFRPCAGPALPGGKLTRNSPGFVHAPGPALPGGKLLRQFRL